MSSEKFEMTAKTFQGLEGVLSDELRELGAENIEVGRRMVSFTGDKLLLYKANYCLRTALRVLKPIIRFNADNADTLYSLCRDYKWDKVLTVDQTFSIDATVNSEDFRHSRFVTYRVKDAIADWFMENYKKRPSIRIQNADIKLNVHITQNQVTISLDSSGESLHKRGYRVAQTEAPINEVLAAGLIKLSSWTPEMNMIDPMCGSGTFLIEAALIAGNIYPGVFRDSYAFERWRDFDAELFDSVMNDDSQERSIEAHFYGYDISPKAIDIASKNVKNAGLSKYFTIEVRPLSRLVAIPDNCMLISNPPYGERLDVDDLSEFYSSIGTTLKNSCKGSEAWLIGPKADVFDNIGLKPSIKYPVLNGALECEFRQYKIFDGTYAQFKKEGQSVHNDDFRGTEEVSKRFSGGQDRSFTKSKLFKGDKSEKKGKFSPSAQQKPGKITHRYGYRPEPTPARSPLEEKYRKPYLKRNSKPSHFEFKEPTLGAEHEREIIHGRRKSWMRKDIETSTNNNDNNNNE